MGRREFSTTQDPDVEESLSELIHLESKKEIVQKETLSIAENKRQLEQNFEDTKRVLNEAHELEKADLARELERIIRDIEAANLRKTRAELDSNAAVENRIKQEQAFKTTQKELSVVSTEKSNLQSETEQLRKQKVVANNQLTALEASVHKLTLTEVDLSTEIKKLTEERGDISDGITSRKSAYVELSASHDLLKESHEKMLAVLSTINEDIESKTRELAAVNDRLQRAKRDLLDCTQKSDVESARIKADMGNLALLEQRVGDKHAQLVEAESHFTIEHLARMGYKKLTE